MAEGGSPGHWPTVPEDDGQRMISETLASASRAAAGMRDLLDDLNRSIAKAGRSPSPESRVGRLFLEAQDFVDQVRAETSEWADRTLAGARAEAESIVISARDEAARIIEEARRSAISSEALQSMQSTIDTFKRANAELSRELVRLTQALRQPWSGDANQARPEEVESRNPADQATLTAGGPEPHWASHSSRDAEPEIRHWPARGSLRR